MKISKKESMLWNNNPWDLINSKQYKMGGGGGRKRGGIVVDHNYKPI